jgi:hypothetical protein
VRLNIRSLRRAVKGDLSIEFVPQRLVLYHGLLAKIPLMLPTLSTFSPKTDTLHEVLPARIRTQAVEHRQRELDDSKNPLFVRLLEPLK